MPEAQVETETTKKTKAPKKEKKAKTEVALISVKSGALSTEIGPMIVSGLDKTFNDEQKAHQIIDGVNAKRYDLLAKATFAIMKAAKADDSIDLASTFSDDSKAA